MSGFFAPLVYANVIPTSHSLVRWYDIAMAPRTKPVYHGSRSSLIIRAAIGLMEKNGLTGLKLSDVADELGVSVEDIQDLFPDLPALYLAIAEQAVAVISYNGVSGVGALRSDDPIAQLEAYAQAYIEFAARHPVEFKVVSSRRLFEYEQSEYIRRSGEGIRVMVLRQLRRAQDSGLIDPEIDIDLLMLSGRAFAYGLARLIIDQQFDEWNEDLDPLSASTAALHEFANRVLRTGPATVAA